MEVDSPKGLGGGVVTSIKTGSKRTHSGELASSPQGRALPSPDEPNSLLTLISQIFKVAFTVSVSLLILLS